MALHVMDEANHCLGCKKPRCQQGCPIHTNIPEVIRLLKDNKLDDAGKMLFENNPLTTVCSLVCNHENQCEGHCVQGIKGAPVHFSVIENYISSTYASQMTKGPATPNGKKAAIIGSGPAGLTIAVILARYGYDVTIFESHDKIGGVLRYGIPEFRLPKSVLDDFEYRHLRLKDIKVRPNTDVGKALRLEDLFRDGYKAIFIGTGVWRPNTLHIKGESLGNVHYAINYLQNPDVYHLGRRLIGAESLPPAAWLYLKIACTGLSNPDARYVMIDEVQDYTIPQLAVLARFFPRAHFMLLGDENQAIREGGLTFAQVKSTFERLRGEVSECHLMTSYRSTPSITDLFARLLPESERMEVSSVQRESSAPRVEVFDDKDAWTEAVREAVREALAQGMPAIAECGGFLYLLERLTDDDGTAWPLVGACPGGAERKPHGRFGYIELETQEAGLLGPAGTVLRGHEFHRWEADDTGAGLLARKPESERFWHAGHHTPSLYAGFPHLYLPGSVDVARRFVHACAAWGAQRKDATCTCTL